MKLRLKLRVSLLLRSLKTQKLQSKIAQKLLTRAQSMIKIKLTLLKKRKKKTVMSYTFLVS